MDMTALIADLDGIRIEQNDKIVLQKSRDFYWYSPVLKRQLDHVTGDIVVSPKTEDELIRVLKARYGSMLPVTPRGTHGNLRPGDALVSRRGAEPRRPSTTRRACPRPRLSAGPAFICSDLDRAGAPRPSCWNSG